MQKAKQIRHMVKDRENSTKDYFALDWVTATVEGSFIKRYCGMLSLLTGLKPCARNLLDYVVEAMDDDNLIDNTANLKTQFNKKSEKSYSETSIDRAFKELTEKRILIKSKRRGRGKYKVNPKYFFKGNEENRIKSIRFELEKPIKAVVDKYRGKKDGVV